jgi:GT2 family glycosyltransferase
MAFALERLPDCDLLYSDEDRLSRRYRRYHPCFKPDWPPEFLLSSNYIGRLAMLRVAAARAVGGFRNYDNAEEWDLLLRLSRSGARVRRLPRCLYHRAEADVVEGSTWPEVVLRDHCKALGLSVTTTTADSSRAIWDVQGKPTVSIVIPNRNAAPVIMQCMTGLLHRTGYQRIEIVIVDNNSTDPEVHEFYRSLDSDPRVRVVPFDRPFNFSAACNRGAEASHGDLLLFLNNDIEIIDPDWLDELVRWAQLPAIGVAGAKLLYPDRTIQHAGVVFGIGLVGHIFARAPEGSTGLFGSSEACRNYLAVTGACQMMRRDVFERLGGFDERFRISFSDVVFCMEAWRAGYRVVYAPHARLVHHESYTRKRDDSAQDMELLARYLQDRGFVEDPFLHPELNPKSFVPSLRPPFDPVPQQVVRDYVNRVLAAAAH